jgi:hypothetical protein
MHASRLADECRTEFDFNLLIYCSQPPIIRAHSFGLLFLITFEKTC